MTRDEIYDLYCKGEYSKPKHLQVLADVAGIDMYELLNIIKQKENDKMAQHKWTDEENAELLRLANNGATPQELASVFNTSAANISWRVNMLRRKQPKEAAKVNDDILAGAIAQSYADAELPDADTGEDLTDINKAIAECCEVPDPVELDPEDEAAIALRANQVQVRQVHPQPQTIFDRVHDIIKLLQESAEFSEIAVNCITLTINSAVVDVSASNSDGECIGWHKKYQPVADQAAD